MSEPVPHLEYFFGEEVVIRLSFTHHDAIFAVEAVFAHSENRTYTLIVKGNPDLVAGSPVKGPKKRSTVVLHGEFQGSHIPGVYGVERVLFHTLAGPTIHDDAFVKEVPWRTLKLRDPVHSVSDLEVDFYTEDD